jgi:6-methylsalicylate decarboxylase
MTLVDVHHHILPPAFVAAERAEILAFAGDERVLDWAPATALAALDRFEIETAYTSLGVPGTREPAVARACNEYAAELCSMHPGRFRSFASLPLPDIEASLDELGYALDELGAAGIGLLSNYDGRHLGDPAFAPLLAELDRREAVVHVHPIVPPACRGASGARRDPFLEFPFDTARCAASLLATGALERYSHISFILSHGGGPTAMLATRIGALTERAGHPADPSLLRRLHVDAVTSTAPGPFGLVQDFFGTEHVLFGSDHPYVPIELTAGGLQRLAIDPAARSAVSAGNARALLGD